LASLWAFVEVGSSGIGLICSMVMDTGESDYSKHHKSLARFAKPATSYLGEHVGGDETIAHQVLSPLRPHSAHLFASSHWPVDTGCCQEAIVITRGSVRQPGLKEERQ